MQKAVRGLEVRRFGLGCDRRDRWGTDNEPTRDEIIQKLATPNAERIWYLRYAFKAGMTVDDVFRQTKIDRWFLHAVVELIEVEDELKACPSLDAAPPELILKAKQNGFVDRQLATIWNVPEEDVRSIRKGYGIEAVFKSVDTCAAEFEAYTPYYYSTYERGTATQPPEDEVRPST